MQLIKACIIEMQKCLKFKIIQKMVWYMNFCAPFLPNDPIINFHRTFQTSEVLFLLIFYVVLHTYYKFFMNQEMDQVPEKEDKEVKSQSTGSQNDRKNINYLNEDSEHDKAISINLQKPQLQNESYIGLKVPQLAKTQQKKRKGIKNQPIPMDIEELQDFFPIVFGHHSIAMTASIMYSPYAQQSIIALLYAILAIILVAVNIKRKRRATYGIWITMCIFNIILLMSALLEVGQSNFDYINQKCFSQVYVPLY